MQDFMELALYDEQQGYYSAHVQDIGFRGDFSTSATMSDLLARRITAHWKEACDTYSRNLPLIEIGGGNANLALSVARELGFWGRLKARYYIVDRSPALRRLQSLVGGNFVRVYPTIEEALKHAGGHAFIFCNELPDAFPARQFIYSSDAWHELGLTVHEEQIAIQPHPCPHLPQSTVFTHWAREGQIVEVHESYHRWYTAWQPLWKSGIFTTIDYGAPCDRLYYRRPGGSLRGYKSHILLGIDELIAYPGHCDMTADVNFTDLQRLAERNIGDFVQLMSQRDYLAPFAHASSPADQHLIAIPGAGDHFCVLIQQRFSN